MPEESTKRKPPTALLIVLGLVILGAVAFVFFRSNSTSPLQKAADTCQTSTTDDGKTVTVLILGGVVGLDSWNCLATNLPVPDYVQQELGNATALSGPITVSWDNYTATASYNGVSKSGSFTIHEN
jgi:hypothetical protein